MDRLQHATLPCFSTQAIRSPSGVETDQTRVLLVLQGIKLELFIFDTFPMAADVALLEVPRAEQFAPVKNTAGVIAESSGLRCREAGRPTKRAGSRIQIGYVIVACARRGMRRGRVLVSSNSQSCNSSGQRVL